MAGNAWYWTLNDASGAPVQVSADFADRTFADQAEAEAWVGEFFADLAAEGVDSVTLFEGGREVYGPMSLHA
ncbi:hypothetical protein [Nocardioides daphniae]|uniref:Uncharacterized protein n=1 Tax=Nocardioides daphniae TaxID=402297 RepID=A0A4P7UD64_9ACTN|nr:hypothetical protein [Nocardioides daphniae]QCC77481.1 hypothetical protein E2C04_10400 [Nocardioides daphniae]GGD31596.1 hypothetical protein GCM10007231_33900 [Nocardioides daphniae]